MLIEYGNTVVVPDWKLNEDEPTGFSRVYYVLRGDVTYEAENEKVKLKPGFLYALPSNVPYRAWRDPSQDFACTYLHIDFYEARVTGLIELEVCEDDCMGHFIRTIQRAIDEERLDLLESLADAMASFFRASPFFQRSTAMLNQVRDYVMRNIAEPIGVEELARMFSYHPNYFIRLFQQESGFTPHQFIMRLRMQYAVIQLNKCKSNQEVGYACGFTDSSTFTRAFRKYYGVTPQKYMRGFRRP